MSLAWVCMVCRTPLNRRVETRNGRIHQSFEHAADALGTVDHEPRPALLNTADQRSICDFCGVSGVSWAFEAENFDMLVGTHPDGYDETVRSVDDWYACDACKVDLMAHDPDGLVRRWAGNHTSMAKAQRRTIGRFQRRLLTDFWEHSTGVVRSLEGGRP